MGSIALRRPRLWLPFFALVVLTGLSAWTSTAGATLAGNVGRIAYTNFDGTQYDVYTMRPDGGDKINVTSNAAADTQPSWSPDGTKIAFASTRSGNSDIWVMNADGSSPVRLTTNAATDFAPSWSADATKIAFQSNRDGNMEIYAMNADGTSQTRLTNNAALDAIPDWSPNNAEIAFVSSRDGNQEIYKMNADGTSQTRLTTSAGFDTTPAWDSTGTYIYFASDRTGNREVFYMNPDGTGATQFTNLAGVDEDPAPSANGLYVAHSSDRTGNYEIFVGSTNLTNDSNDDTQPDWQRAPGPVNSGSMEIPLVPSYRQCGTGGNPANATHRGPLSSASCIPPRLTGTARIGPASYLNVLMQVVYGNPTTVPNGSDDTYTVTLTDIRTAAGADYNPNGALSDLTLVTRWRITDLANGPSENQAGTVIDLDFAVPVDCAATADVTVGASCTASTSAAAVSSGTVQENEQQALQMFRIRVNDSGPNGARGDGDDTLFLQQGLYNP